MLNKLANIANILDDTGMHKEADVVTNVLIRVANFFKHQDGPIQDFQPETNNDLNFQPSFTNQQPNVDKLEIMKIHAALRSFGIDPSGLEDVAAFKMYQELIQTQ